MRRFFTTESSEGPEETLVKSSFRKELFTTEDTESTEKKLKKGKPEARKPEARKPEARKPEARKPEARKPEKTFSVCSVLSVVNMLFDCDGRLEEQPCF